MAGNVFLKGAKPSKHEAAPLLKPNFDPQLKLVEKPDGWYLAITLDKSWATGQTRKLVTTELLGKAKIPDLPFENPDGTLIRIATDYFGHKREEANPFPGPFELPAGGKKTLKVWPVSGR
jgi:alpha-N-arabinofuranosidase